MSKLKAIRESIPGMTQAELGRLVGCSQGAIGHYEAGRRAPSLDDCRAITAALCQAGALNERGEPVTLDDVFPPESAADGEAA